ncbi:MAG TPA: branched-chain amino acid ABC transporter permease [Clostridia bacterium]|mgnify:CR=1 FL=1|nr:branched-chain amino acid ABC transporter permease [Clostridia bacterium]HRX43214.1 branched-chain amino acid ABC transporter permease [Clostridia bacterium]
MYLLEQLINGICQGSIYALMAIGYAVIYGVVGLVTFTYGEIIMMGSFSAFYYFILFGDNLFFALIAGFITAAVVGIVVHKVCYQRFLDAPRYISLICTIGMSMFLKNFATIVFGSEMKGMPSFLSGKFIEIGTIRVGYLQLLIIGIVILLSLLLTLYLKKTRMGMKLRAVSQDKKAAALVGINVKTTTLIGNCIGCGLGGVAGILLGVYYNSVLPTMGGMAGLKAFSSMVLGGLGSIGGSAIGGVLIGVVENLGIALTSSGLRDVFAFLLLVLVLVIRPQGLFGKKGN